MKKIENLQCAITILAILLIAAALITVFQRNGGTAEDYSDTSTPAEAFVQSGGNESGERSAEIGDESQSVNVSREYPAKNTEKSSDIKRDSSEVKRDSSETSTEPFKNLSKPFNETTTEAPETEPAADDGDYEYQNGHIPGDYIGYFTLTAYEWSGQPMADGQYPYYGAVACNSLPLGTWIYIEGYGTFQVCDRGGMANNVIDIYLGDEDACWEFGVRGADVYYG